MQVAYIPEGLEAVVFTADGDMRQALNNLQATVSGFQFVNQENVFKVLPRFPNHLWILLPVIFVIAASRLNILYRSVSTEDCFYQNHYVYVPSWIPSCYILQSLPVFCL